MADAREIELCDKLVSVVKAAWNPSGNDSVSQEFLAPVTTSDLKDLVGRKVYLFPGPWSREFADRGEDIEGYQIGAITINRFPEASGPTSAEVKAWMREQVYWVQAYLFDLLDYSGRTLLALGSRRFWTQSIDVVQLYDQDELARNNVFRCDLAYQFRELQTR